MTPGRRQARAALCLAATVVCLLAGAGAAQAATTTLKPAADSYVDFGLPGSNFGSATGVRVDGSPVLKGYLKFDAGALTEPVTRARLRLYSHSATGTGVTVHGVADDGWTEGAVTAANAPAHGAAAASSGGFGSAAWVTIDVTSLVKDEKVVSLAVNTTSTTSKLFSSREVAAQAPELVVETAAPPPPPPPPPSGDPVIAAAGDVACDPVDPAYNGGLGTSSLCRQQRTSDLLVGGDLAAVLGLGDLQYDASTLANFMQVFDPSWGRAKPIIRPAAGNHEYKVAAAGGYFDYFNGVGIASGPAGARGQGYYSFDIGSWHLVALNSNCAFIGGCGAGSPQEQWLRADLAAHPNRCTLAYFHHPLYTSASASRSPAVAPLWQALYDARADVVLSGHAHNYERFARQDASGRLDRARGLRQFVVGTGGKSLVSHDAVMPGSGVRGSRAYGVLRLQLKPDSYEWRFAPEAGATFSDTGRDVCDGVAEDTAAPTAPTALTASASPGSVALAWSASSDNDGVSGYRVIRDGVQIGTTATAGYTDTGRAPSATHTYRVVAVDPAGNASAESNAATVTLPGNSVLSFAPVHDSYVRADQPNTNFGAATTLQVDGSPLKHVLMRFSVAGLAGRPVVSAKLRLHAVDPSPKGGDFRLVSDPWSQSTVTWNTAPAAGATPVAALGSVSAGKLYEVDVTPLVTGDGDVNLKVTSTASDGADYYSREGAIPPQLVVTTG